jgi:DNA processing protein
VLYARGNIAILNDSGIAIVGSRNMTEYGQRVCEDITQQLSSLGLTIISGLAEGIDTVAHQSCLNNHGRTIAVLGSGINDNCIFPAHNRKLAENIISSGGVILSEYPPNMKAQRQFFPARNRIISGLSLGTIIIEAREKSGALITAYQALEQNREVFAVPGSIYSSRSSGCHKLIQKGAKLIQNVQDIIEELPTKTIINNVRTCHGMSLPHDLSPNEQQILQLFSSEPMHIDKIIKSCRLSKSCLLASLTSLELKGIIQKNNNNHYILCQKI